MRLTSPLNTKAIVGIPKGSFLVLKSIKVNGINVWNGSYTGGVKGISWAGEDSRYIKFNVVPGIWNFLGTGSLKINSPKLITKYSSNGVKLNKKSWTAKASVKDSTFLFSGEKIPINVSAANAIDGDYWTGWRDMTRKQYPGQWLMIDMKKLQKFDKIELDNTWALYDSPNTNVVCLSNDGLHWRKPIAEGSGKLGMTVITFPLQEARYFRITQTGNDPTYNWSIYEIDVYRKK